MPFYEINDEEIAEAKKVAKRFPRLIGFAIVSHGWTSGPHYYSVQHEWLAIDDEGKMECPKLFSPSKAKSLIRWWQFRGNDELPSVDKCSMVLWLAPQSEWHETPLDTYIKMTGSRLPGTPRQ